MDAKVKHSLLSYQSEVEVELSSILDWWMEHMLNKETGFFYGEISGANIPDGNAPIGLVLQSRILWTFSAAYNHTQNKVYLSFAHTAYKQLITQFYDNEYGGMFWSVHPNGSTVSTKKQAYGIAFAIYGLSAYYEATKDQAALDKAAELYRCLDMHFYDPVYGGYIECLGNDFSVIEDVRLSDKDQNAIKSMNTHLHVIEAYAKLYTVLPSQALKQSVTQLLDIFEQHIIDPTTSQQKLFFEKDCVEEFFWLKDLNTSSDRQIGLPYSINWGGGSWGLKHSFFPSVTSYTAYSAVTTGTTYLLTSGATNILVDGNYGTFEGYGSVFGNKDLGNDVIEMGAFTKSLKRRKPKRQRRTRALKKKRSAPRVPNTKPTKRRGQANFRR